MPEQQPVAVPNTLRWAAAMSWRLLIVAVAVAAIVYALARLRLVVLPVIVALLLATLLVPPARALERRGAPPALAALVVMLLSILVLAGLSALLVPQFADELGQLSDRVEDGATEAGDWLATGPLNLSEGEVDRAVEDVADGLRENSGGIGRGVLTGAIVLAEVIAGLLLALVVLFFFIKDGERLWRSIVGVLPPARRKDAQQLGVRAWHVLSAYVRGIAVVALFDSVAIGLALVVIGVPLVLPLMALTFFGAFFPLVGATVAGLAAALVALVSEGVVAALLVVAAVVIVQQVEGDLLYPVIVGRALALHPVVVLLGLTAGAVMAGIAGAFLAVPVLGVAASAAAYLRERGPPAAQPGTT